MNQDDVRRILAKNIKKRRKELGITQIRLAELAEISEPYMNDIERCQTWVSDKTLAKLAHALNLSLDQLFINGEATDFELDKKNIYLLFQQCKENMHESVENSLENLLRDIMKN